MWDTVRDEIPDIDVLTFDAPGFGDSPRGEELSDGEPTTKTFVNAIKEALDELGIKMIALGGLSMGGSVAADFTHAYPEMIAGLALMDTNIDSDDDDRKAFRRGVAEMADRGEGYDAVKEWTTTMVGPDTPQEIRDSLDERFKALPNEGLAWIQRAMANREDRSGAVSLVRGPVYFVRGTEDPTASLESYMKLALRTDQPRIKEIPGVGHFAADEKPVELAKILRDFYNHAARWAKTRH